LRFGFKGPSGTYAVAIKNQDSNRVFIREFTISGGDANTDTLQTVTFPGDTSGTWDKDNTLSFQLIFTFAVGSTYQTTADAWQSGNYFGTSSTSNGIGTTSDVFEIFDDESITFFENGEWEFTIKGTSIKSKYPLGMRQLKEHINGTNK
jgi:hypothetical protein